MGEFLPSVLEVHHRAYLYTYYIDIHKTSTLITQYTEEKETKNLMIPRTSTFKSTHERLGIHLPLHAHITYRTF